MVKFALVIIVAVTFAITPAFAESSIKVQTLQEKINALDSILVTGKITGVTEYKPVKLFVTDSDGFLVFAPEATIGDGGKFSKLINPPIPSFNAGVYTVTATHEDTVERASASFVVVAQELPRNDIKILTEEPREKGGEEEEPAIAPKGGIMLSANATNGSNVIKVSGNTSIQGTDLTLTVTSPTGNLVSIGQVTPGIGGAFETEIKTGGPLWKEDGFYTITANQGVEKILKQSIQVQIEDGVIIPEFGTIAAMILTVSIIAIIATSAKSRLGITISVH